MERGDQGDYCIMQSGTAGASAAARVLRNMVPFFFFKAQLLHNQLNFLEKKNLPKNQHT